MESEKDNLITRECCVFGCENKFDDKNICFYKFIRNSKNQTNLWLEAVKPFNIYPSGKYWIPTKKSKICNKHFVGNAKHDNPNNISYVPSIFTDSEKKINGTPHNLWKSNPKTFCARQAIINKYLKATNLYTTQKVCCIINCDSNSEQHPEIEFRRFPDYNEEIKQKWKEALKNKIKDSVPFPYICSNHFSVELFNSGISDYQIPNLFPKIEKKVLEKYIQNSSSKRNNLEFQRHISRKIIKCCVPGCNNVKKSTRNKKKIQFFPVPKDEVLKAKWLKNISIESNITNTSVVCSDHFEKTDFKIDPKGHSKNIKNNAVPSLKLEIEKPLQSGNSSDDDLWGNSHKIKELEQKDPLKAVEFQITNSAIYQTIQHMIQIIEKQQIFFVTDKYFEILGLLHYLNEKFVDLFALMSHKDQQILILTEENDILKFKFSNEIYNNNNNLNIDDVTITDPKDITFSDEIFLNSIDCSQDDEYFIESDNECEVQPAPDDTSIKQEEVLVLEETNNDKIKCKFCNKFIESIDIDEHYMKFHPKLLVCEKCGMYFTSYTKLKLHEIDEKFPISKIKPDQIVDLIDRCKFPECNKEFYGKNYRYYDHINAHNNQKKYYCNICKTSFTLLHNAIMHFKKSKNKYCTPENITFPDYAPKIIEENKEYKIEKEINKYKCAVCEIQLKSFKLYREHMQVHSKPIGYKCSCKIIFLEAAEMANHLCITTCKLGNCKIATKDEIIQFDVESKKNIPISIITRATNKTNLNKKESDIAVKDHGSSTTNNVTVTMKNSDTKRDTDILACKICDEKNVLFQKLQEYNEHFRKVHCKNENNLYECIKCEATFDEDQDLMNHYIDKGHFANDLSFSPKRNLTPIKIKYNCCICNLYFTAKNFYLHLQNINHKILENDWKLFHNLYILSCFKCTEFSTESIYDYLIHLQTVHKFKNIVNNLRKLKSREIGNLIIDSDHESDLYLELDKDEDQELINTEDLELFKLDQDLKVNKKDQGLEVNRVD